MILRLKSTASTCRRDRLISDHLSLIPPIAQRLKQGLPDQFLLEDLLSAGVVGLIEATTRYVRLRPGKKPAKFSTFAYRRIRGAMLDSVRRGQYRLATASEIDPATASSSEGSAGTDRACDLRQLMIGLTDRETHLLQLCYWQGMSSREASVPMGLTPRQSRRLYERTMRKLRMAARADFAGSGDYTNVSVPKKEPKTPQARVISLLVDELGALREEIAAREKRESEIIKQIRAQADQDAKPETSIVFEGRMYSALVSAHGSRQKVSDKPKVFEILGRAGFFEHCSFSVEKAEKLLTEEQFSAVVTVDKFCSPRKVDSAARAALTQKKAA